MYIYYVLEEKKLQFCQTKNYDISLLFSVGPSKSLTFEEAMKQEGESGEGGEGVSDGETVQGIRLRGDVKTVVQLDQSDQNQL